MIRYTREGNPVSKAKRSKTLYLDRLNHSGDRREATHLVQWTYARQVPSRFGPAFRTSHLSVVRRPGIPGFWVAKPYYICARPLRFRRLSRRASLAVWIGCWRGWMDTTRWSAKKSWWRASSAVAGCFRRFWWSIRRRVWPRKDVRELNRFFRDMRNGRL